jgi:protein-S-isoprenylcysteine O-methyltransferase Ste14
MIDQKILPPTIFLIALVSLVILHLFIPFLHFNIFWLKILGCILIMGGISITLWADSIFKKHNTTVKPFEESNTLIDEGPFRFSRNPMYLGMASILFGISLILQSAAPFIISLLFIIIVDKNFIVVEEKALETKFGSKFIAYNRKVRKWF